MSPGTAVGFVAVSVVIVAVPGPSVVFAIGRAIAGGSGPALRSVLGNAGGLFVQAGLVAIGLGVLVAGSETAYRLLQIVGAVYLIHLGVSTIRHRTRTASRSPTSTRAFCDGFVVGVSNPKSVIFLAVLLPQYVEPAAAPPALQMVLLGALFCLLAVVCDSAWAIAAARARGWLTRDPRRPSWMSVAGGVVMVGLGVSLLASGR